MGRSPDRDAASARRPVGGEPESVSGVGEGAELLLGVRAGDSRAFDAMARECAPRMYRMALHLCGRVEDAEDLVQETLVRALPALRRFEGRAALSTYLMRALANVWKNRLRSRSRSRLVDWFRGRRNAGEEDRELDPPDRSPSAQQILEAEDAAARIRAALPRLAPERRVALLLREVEELSYEEIAAITQVPIGTVRSRLARAREDLRQIVGEHP